MCFAKNPKMVIMILNDNNDDDDVDDIDETVIVHVELLPGAQWRMLMLMMLTMLTVLTILTILMKMNLLSWKPPRCSIDDVYVDNRHIQAENAYFNDRGQYDLGSPDDYYIPSLGSTVNGQNYFDPITNTKSLKIPSDLMIPTIQIMKHGHTGEGNLENYLKPTFDIVRKFKNNFDGEIRFDIKHYPVVNCAQAYPDVADQF